jgi:hypothetical protein
VLVIVLLRIGHDDVDVGQQCLPSRCAEAGGFLGALGNTSARDMLPGHDLVVAVHFIDQHEKHDPVGLLRGVVRGAIVISRLRGARSGSVDVDARCVRGAIPSLGRLGGAEGDVELVRRSCGHVGTVSRFEASACWSRDHYLLRVG